ncbi:tetratricopeptide repeat protein [Prochlorococcus marinus]|uniref:tetratricopeptide repeat protein n=1 Tax=Prochlorococcus marinus TaxID=1219 RepID=UPI0022B5CF98|nr:tetratricopeptide repeat protein [Prochlorococcus marinus]
MKGLGEEHKSKKKIKPSKEQIINQAFKFHSEGNISEASKYYQYFIAQDYKDPKVFSNYGMILKGLGKLKEAEVFYRKAIELKPDYAMAHSNLGNTLKDLGKLKEAELSTRKAIQLKPDYAIAHSNLGNVLKDLGKLKEAELSTRKAIQFNPDFAEAHSNLGSILRDLGKFKEAELSTRKAIELNPNIAEPYANLGSILKDLGKFKEAEISMHKAIQLKPDYAMAYSNLGGILKDLGKSKEAQSCFQKCLELDPDDLAYNIQAKLFISKIPLNQLQINQDREEINRQISLIGNNNNIIYKNNSLPTTIDFIFYLAYHNCYNDKEILQNIANNLSKKDGILNTNFRLDQHIKESQGRKRIRLGICSSYFFNHSVTKCFLNLIEDLAKSGIEIIIFKGELDHTDKTTDHIISLASEIITLPDSLEKSCQKVLNSSIDILLYLDIGMSVKTYFMSLSRLALVQVLHSGHPQTSGSQNMDYYITASQKENENSDKFFSERLIRMTRLPVNYSLPTILNSTIKASDLDIYEDDFIIGLPHTLFKYHPDFDDILDKVLEEIPHSRLLFFEGVREYNTKELLSRWEQNSKYISSRLIICPRVKFDDYLTISKRFDIVLDTIYFGMGNTFFQAMALGIPVVTLLPDKPQGGCVSAGYKQMGILNPPIAKSKKEYISICKKLAFDNSYRENISNQILLKAKDNLFNDQTVYRQYIDFFQKALKAAYKKELLPKNWEPFKY